MQKTRVDTPSDYSGCILTGNFSEGLKKRVARCILCYQEAEKNGNPAVQYLSAWKEKENQLKKTEAALQAANQKLEKLVNLDGLTQIRNRRSFDRVIQQEWKRLHREGGVLSLILCDVDDFKAFNDTYGHQAGDDCLRSVASVFNGKIERPADLAARYGGEEFAVILPNTSAKGAFYKAESFRKAIELLLIPHTRSSTGDYVTVSFGVSTLIPDGDTSPDALIANADKALYKAKESGRNKVVALPFGPALL